MSGATARPTPENAGRTASDGARPTRERARWGGPWRKPGSGGARWRRTARSGTSALGEHLGQDLDDADGVDIDTDTCAGHPPTGVVFVESQRLQERLGRPAPDPLTLEPGPGAHPPLRDADQLRTVDEDLTG